MPGKILIVDDSKMSREILRRILQSDYELLEASGGAQAVEILHKPENHVSAILLDIIMPEYDGYDVLKRIRSDKDLRQIPVIVITESSDADAENKSFEAGATDFVSKPFNAETVRHRVHNAVSIYETSAQFETLMQNAGSGISAVTFDDDCAVRFVYSNDKYYSLLGYTKEQFDREIANAFDIVHPDDKERVSSAINLIFSTGKERSYDYRCFRRDGSIVYIRCNAAVVHIAGVEKSTLLSVTTDITEQKKAEQLLSSSSDRLQAIVSNIASGITAVMTDDAANVEYIFVTDRYYELLGYTREQFKAEVKNPFDLIHPDDKDRVMPRVMQINHTGESDKLEFRAIRRDGREIWLNDVITLIHFADCEKPVQLSVFTDITERKTDEENLRMSEEVFRIAAAIGGRVISRYDIKNSYYYHNDPVLFKLGFEPVIENMPQAMIDKDVIAPECTADYIEFYERLKRGEKTCSVDTAVRDKDGGYRWYHREATVVFDSKGEPSQAIIVITDITEQREKEAVYIRWMQSIQQKPAETYTLIRCNIAENTSFYSLEGRLLKLNFNDETLSFNAWTLEYAKNFVHPEDRERYVSLLDADTLITEYYRGKRIKTVEYRELLPEEKVRWISLTVELVEYQLSSDIEACLMYEDIDKRKRAELLAIEQAESDPLTGVLNRVAFARKLNELIAENPASQHTVMMLDIDGFKQLNDVFGHAAGDKELIDIANTLRSVLRHGDLLGRLGGDEFLLCLRDVPYNAVVDKKASQILSMTRKIFSMEVQVSVSIGISVYPADGEDFDSLYHNADAALYSVKNLGKDNYAYFNRDIQTRRLAEAELAAKNSPVPVSASNRRRMLIVDDNRTNRERLEEIFKDDFTIESAGGGSEALIRMRHYGAGIAVMLLDLRMPGTDGFAVLEKMQSSMELRTIPVIAISDSEDAESSLMAIKAGAADFVPRPIEADLIKTRVLSAISKAENEKLRAQNGYLLLQSGEEAKYRTVLDSTGTVVIEFNWISGAFTYDPSIVKHIAGKFDKRKLWRILLSDMVAEALDVKTMQELVHEIANDRERDKGGMMVKLKTPEGARRWFRMLVFKQVNEFKLTEKLIITFVNVNDEVIANETLRYRAEHDGLTGLYNRRTFLSKTEQIVSERPSNSYVLAVCDIDGFKMVNDRLGHAEGDKLLRYVADRLQADIKKIDGICGRIGSDVFVMLIPNTLRALEHTNKYPKELLAQYPLAFDMNCSVGYYVIDDTATSAEIMLDRAIMAKQTVKRNYDSKVAWYGEQMRLDLVAEQNITGSMESALRSGMFDIYVQPQFNHVTGQISGAEALVRWLHPDRGVMYLPGEFIPLFERNGFITKLDEFVWDRTAELLGAWLAKGNSAVPISVNVSRLDTHDPLLCGKLLKILNKHNVPPELFRLEVTESLFEEYPVRFTEVIKTLQEAGFLIEMDDFGSGYSSLNILKDVPVDIIKLDMRFFSDTDYSERSGMILNAVMRMARWLGIPVIAEGVEDIRQADYLASIGCPVVQGYLYSAPMPVHQFEKLLEKSGITEQGTKSFDLDGELREIDFWSFKSFDSKLFYNYMGAAVIYEYKSGKAEVIRVNRRFFSMMQLAPDALLPLNEIPGASKEEYARFCAASEKVVVTGEEQKLTLERRINKTGELQKLVCTIRLMPSDGGNSILLCCMEDISSYAAN